jgi:AcrR family transcriptional regulator
MARSLRADAQANYDRLLEVAARAFAAEGADASLKAIAAEAGVGIGTLYRRFPAREDLIEATYRNETARLGQLAAELLAERDPVDALREWMERFADYMLTKRGMTDAWPPGTGSACTAGRSWATRWKRSWPPGPRQAGSGPASRRATSCWRSAASRSSASTRISATSPPG